MSRPIASVYSLSGRGLAALTVALVLTHCAPAVEAPDAAVPQPPETRRDDVVDVLHGVEISDPYRWLEDQTSSETRAWIDAQNAYTDSVLGQLPRRHPIATRLEELMRIDTVGSPVVRDERYFFSKRKADEDLAVIYVRDGWDGEDEVLLDPHPLSPDHTVSVSLLDVSADGSLLAYGVRSGGEDEIEIRFLDVDERLDLEDTLPRGRYFTADITPDKRGVYYTRHDDGGPRLYRHRLGSSWRNDEELFGEELGAEKILISELSDDGRFLLATVLYGSAADKTDVYLCDLTADGPFVTVVDDIPARFEVSIAGDRLVLNTNWEAPNGRLLTTAVSQPDRQHWQEAVAERPGSAIQSVSAVAGRLFVNYLTEVRSHVSVFDLGGSDASDIVFDTLGTIGAVSGSWDGTQAFFSFSSFHLPTAIYEYQPASNERRLWWQVDVPLDSDELEVSQVWYESKDGTRVSMFLVHRADMSLDGSNPTLLTGYGGFNLSRTPGFSASAVVWAELGGVYAVANLRGGGEFGEAWHRAGMLENKQNVFDDFIAAAEWLVANDYTSSAKLAIRGGSNGGLLVGAAMNQRPDLFGAVICTYPLLDMLRYHRFLVAGYWVPEYGSAEDPEQFEFLRAYSPYHNVRSDVDYPAVLYISGDGDTRVAPLHARKMAALMQSIAPPRPALLRYHVKAGHSGGQPVSERVQNDAEGIAFLLWQLGEDEPS